MSATPNISGYALQWLFLEDIHTPVGLQQTETGYSENPDLIARASHAKIQEIMDIENEHIFGRLLEIWTTICIGTYFMMSQWRPLQ